MLDLNDFKVINDTKGHEEGDRILQETGMLLADAFGENHCYRYGGDEFLVIVPDLSASELKRRLKHLEAHKPVIAGASRVDFSVGCVRATPDDSNELRALVASADEKMYELKRDKKRAAAAMADETRRASRPRSQASERTPELGAEYTTLEMRSLLERMAGQYDVARLVDPIEGRVLDIRDDGKVGISERCYGVWNGEHKCINCSSALACRTGRSQHKTELFEGQVYSIASNPVRLRLKDGSAYDAVVELVSVNAEEGVAANNREAENVGSRALHYRADHDSLTGVLNADAFYEHAREAIAGGSGSAWVMVAGNIVHLRRANDALGVRRGNEMLVRTATLLMELAEEADGVCGRLEDDRFALMVPEEAFAEDALLAVSRELAEEFASEGYTLHLRFGVCAVDDPLVPVAVTYGRASAALRDPGADPARVVAYYAGRA